MKAQSIAPAAGVDAVRIMRESSTLSKEQVQIQMYLSKLKELVPHMPKNRRVSKLEVIQHVIDYICDLQSALEQNRPAILQREQQRRNRSHSASDAGLAPFVLPEARQPLGILSAVPGNVPTPAGDKDAV